MSDWDKTQEEKTCWRKEPESHGRWVSKGGLRDRCGRRPEIWRRWGSLAELGVGWQGGTGGFSTGKSKAKPGWVQPGEFGGCKRLLWGGRWTEEKTVPQAQARVWLLC